MHIGIIGSGHIGKTLAELFTKAGQLVMVSERRQAQRNSLLEQASILFKTGSISETAVFGEIVVLALPWEAAVMQGALPDADLFLGKIVIDAMNPYRMDGQGLHESNGVPSSKRVASLLPQSRIVKAFNTMFWEELRDTGDLTLSAAQRNTIFLAGDDIEAKQVVSGLIDAIGFAAMDIGGLDESVGQEPGTPLYNHPLAREEAIAALASFCVVRNAPVASV